MSQKQTESTLLSMKRVLEIVPVSKTQLYRMIDTGEFPKQVPIGRQRVAFLGAEVDAWFENRLRLRDEGVGAEARRARAKKAVGGRR